MSLTEVKCQILAWALSVLPGQTGCQKGSRKEALLSRRIEWSSVTALQQSREELPENKKPDFSGRPFNFSQ